MGLAMASLAFPFDLKCKNSSEIVLPTEIIHFKDETLATELLYTEKSGILHSFLETHLRGETLTLKRIQREIRVMQRVDPVSVEELFKELEMLTLQKNRLREDMMVTACKYVGKELNLLSTLRS